MDSAFCFKPHNSAQMIRMEKARLHLRRRLQLSEHRAVPSNSHHLATTLCDRRSVCHHLEKLVQGIKSMVTGDWS